MDDKLVGHFGPSQCFRDVENIETGADFVDSITTAIVGVWRDIDNPSNVSEITLNGNRFDFRRWGVLGAFPVTSIRQ